MRPMWCDIMIAFEKKLVDIAETCTVHNEN